jgi:hypothetical protein
VERWTRARGCSEKSIFPPIAIRRHIKYPLHNLFLAAFKCIRRDLQKYSPEKLYFHELMADDEAFLIHFLRPNERRPLFKLKVTYPDQTDQVFEYPHEHIIVMHPKEIAIIFEDIEISSKLKTVMRLMVQHV